LYPHFLMETAGTRAAIKNTSLQLNESNEFDTVSDPHIYGIIFIRAKDRKTYQPKGRFMDNCIFCKIINGDIPASKVFEDEHTVVFNDINPQAPVHMLVIPRQHYESVHDIEPQNMDIMKQVFAAVHEAVRIKGLASQGYRLVINSGKSSGQTVPHIHVHILSGRNMAWPPG